MSKPKVPKVQPVPDRRPGVLPDGGDPTARYASRRKRQMMPSAMIFTNQGTLGIPSLAAPSPLASN